MKNLEIFELCVEMNNGWRSPQIKIEVADQDDMFEVATLDQYHIFVFTNNNAFTVRDSDALLVEEGISITGLEFAGEDGVIASTNGYKNCFFYVGDGKEFDTTDDELYLNDFDLESFGENEVK